MNDMFNFDPNYSGNPLEQSEDKDEYQLYLAMNCGNDKIVSEYLELDTKSDVLFPSQQDTALHRAALWGASNLLVRMIQQGADPDTPDLFRNTPLHVAAKRGHLETCLALIALDADIISENEYGATPISLAVTNGHLDLVKAFVQYDGYSSINQKYLISAACAVARSEKSNSEEMINILIDSGFKVDEKDSKGNTPLYVVSGRHNMAIAKNLLAAGANVRNLNNEFESILFPAVRSPSFISGEGESYIQFLLTSGVSLNQCNVQGNSALHIAVMLDNAMAVEELLIAGIDSTLRNCSGKTALDISELWNKAVGVTKEQRLNLERIKRLLNGGVTRLP